MNSLRGRIVVLSALIALFTAVACTFSAALFIRSGISDLDQQAAQHATDGLSNELIRVQQQLHREVEHYANWDDLYQHMPKPDATWATNVFSSTAHPTAVMRTTVLVYDESIVGRYHSKNAGTSSLLKSTSPSDDLVLRLVTAAQTPVGMSINNGNPFLFALSPIRTGTRTGPGKGIVIGIRYFDEDILAKIATRGWDISVTNAPQNQPQQTSKDDKLVIRDVPGGIAVNHMIAAVDGTLTFTLTHDIAIRRQAETRIIPGINFYGLLAAFIALILGSIIGWWLFRPISKLADASGNNDQLSQLPVRANLREADTLRQSFTELHKNLRHEQEQLANALDRQSITNAVHKRFLTQLAHEIGQPLKKVIETIELLHANNGKIDPERAASVRQLVLRLEERLHDVLVLVEEDASGGDTALNRLHIDEYLRDLAELLEQRASQHEMSIVIEAPHDVMPIDARLLSPVLINLTVNAIVAGRQGSVTIRVIIDKTAHSSVWHITDNGPGMADELATRVRDAFQRGEVLPGTPGMGLGLALALANVRALGGRIELVETGKNGTHIAVHVPIDPTAGGRRDTESSRYRRP